LLINVNKSQELIYLTLRLVQDFIHLVQCYHILIDFHQCFVRKL